MGQEPRGALEWPELLLFAGLVIFCAWATWLSGRWQFLGLAVGAVVLTALGQVANETARLARSPHALVELRRALLIAAPIMLLAIGAGYLAERGHSIGLLGWLGAVDAVTPRLASVGWVLAGLGYGLVLIFRLRLPHPDELELAPEDQAAFARAALEEEELFHATLAQLEAEDRRPGAPDAPSLADVLARSRASDESAAQQQGRE